MRSWRRLRRKQRVNRPSATERAAAHCSGCETCCTPARRPGEQPLDGRVGARGEDISGAVNARARGKLRRRWLPKAAHATAMLMSWMSSASGAR